MTIQKPGLSSCSTQKSIRNIPTLTAITVFVTRCVILTTYNYSYVTGGGGGGVIIHKNNVRQWQWQLAKAEEKWITCESIIVKLPKSKT